MRIAARDRSRLERLCRYVSRPPLKGERLSLREDGRLSVKLRRVFRDGTTHILMAPLTFIEKLCALVPPPFFNLVTYCGILAPNAADRAAVVPSTPPRPVHRAARSDEQSPLSRRRRYTWAEMMKRVFGLDVLECPQCGTRRRLIALITDPPVIRAILTCLGLPADPPTIAPARAPPIEELLADPIPASG